jgi:hypothetical protein
MTPFQIVMLVLAAGLIVSTFWGNIAAWLKSIQAPKTPKWIDDIAVDVVRKNHKTDLLEIVACWENLRVMLKKAGMDQAVTELDDIWPLMLEGQKDDKND